MSSTKRSARRAGAGKETMMHLQDTLLDSPQVRRTSGHPVWLARLTVFGWTINGQSRFKALARLKAVANTVTWTMTGRPASNHLRWD